MHASSHIHNLTFNTQLMRSTIAHVEANLKTFFFSFRVHLPREITVSPPIKIKLKKLIRSRQHRNCFCFSNRRILLSKRGLKSKAKRSRFNLRDAQDNFDWRQTTDRCSFCGKRRGKVDELWRDLWASPPNRWRIRLFRRSKRPRCSSIWAWSNTWQGGTRCHRASQIWSKPGIWCH